MSTATFAGRDLTRTLPEFGNSPAPVHARAMMPATATDPEAVRQALANVLMPAWLYREQRYRTAK